MQVAFEGVTRFEDRNRLPLGERLTLPESLQCDLQLMTTRGKIDC